MIVALAMLLFIWGVISFRNLPIEAYPDVANNYVQIITQWPGRAAEEVEQQVTIPIEIVMNGLPHLEHLRSTSLFGLSSVMLVFDDESDNDWNRQKALERLSQVTLPQNLQPQIGHGLQPGRPDLLVHADEHKSGIRPDGVEVARGLGAGEAVQIGAERGGRSSFGGITKEYQVPIDPEQAGGVRSEHRRDRAAA